MTTLEKVENVVAHVAEDVVHKVGNALNEVSRFTIGVDFDRSAGTIFITGGRGVIGHRVAKLLLDSGYPTVRLGVKDQDKVSDLNKMGAEIADFSWENDSSYEKALAGVHTVLVTCLHPENWDRHFPLFLEACKKANVRNVVKVSFYYNPVFGDEATEKAYRLMIKEVPFVQRHHVCDNMLKMSGLSYTILCASHLMSNPLVYQGQNLRKGSEVCFFGASNGRGVNYVSPNDVAEVAVRVLLAPKDHVDQVHKLTGSKTITDKDVSSLLSKYLEKNVTFVDQSLKVFEQEEKMGGDPAWMAADRVGLEKIKASGSEELTGYATNDIENMCGRSPQTFEDYLVDTSRMILAEQPEMI